MNAKTSIIFTLLILALNCTEAPAETLDDQNLVDKPEEQKITKLDDIHNKETFMSAYNDENSKIKDIIFIKKYFPKQDSTLDRVEYKSFLKSFLEDFIEGLPEDPEIKEEAEKHHVEQVEGYLEHMEKKEEYGLDDVLTDIALGNFMVYIDVNHDTHTKDLSDEDMDLELELKEGGYLEDL